MRKSCRVYCNDIKERKKDKTSGETNKHELLYETDIMSDTKSEYVYCDRDSVVRFLLNRKLPK